MVNSTARQIPPRAPIRASISSVSSVPRMAPITTRALRTLEFLTTAAPPTTAPQRAIRRAARRRSSSSSASSPSSISWASWRFRRLPTPTPPSLASISRFPTPHPPLPRSTQRGSTTSSPFRVKTLAGPISPNPTSPSSTARQLPTRLSAATSRCCGLRA